MNEFIVYPAIDLRDGKVVRLKQGKADRQKVYSTRPESVAREWVRQGAAWLHVVNLNGAFGENTNENAKTIQSILGAVGADARIQLGGGIRTLEQIQAVLDLGVSRVVLGTAVMENPDFAAVVLDRFDAAQVAFGLDARGETLLSRGWQSESGMGLYDLVQQLAQMGAQTLIYTNIQRDGMQNGVDWQSTQALAEKSGLRVIASGGTAALEDIVNVRRAGLAGVILGKALYEGNFSLEEALNVR